jgi:hypothetical protein
MNGYNKFDDLSRILLVGINVMSHTNNNSASRIKEEGKRTARKAARQPWVSTLVRFGYAARGIIYAMVGILAIQVAVFGQGKITNQQGAIAAIGAQSGGRILLIIIAVGLAGYALWGLIRAALDPLGKGNDAKGTVTRLGYLISGISYAALLIPTINAIAQKQVIAVTGGGSQQNTAATLLSKSWGPWLVGAAGLAIIGAGIAQIIQGYKADFDMRFDSYAMSSDQRRLATRLGRFGYMARGLVFSIVGLFLLQAALYHNPSKAQGVDGALLALARQPYGTALLALVAAGLIAFGAYSLLGAAWFRLKTT